MIKRFRRKRWVPRLSFTSVTIVMPMMLLVGLLFITGTDFVWGIEGGELHIIPIPKVPLVGWLLILVALDPLIPPIVRHKIKKKVRLLSRYIKEYFKAPTIGGG